MRFAGWAALLVLLAACGGGSRDGMEADTVEFTYDKRAATIDITECGRDGDIVMLGAAQDGLVIQAAVDVSEGGKARTGVTGDMGDDGIFGAFGGEIEHGPAGKINEISVDGDRVIVEAEWVSFDGNLVPQNPSQLVDGKLVARCPESETATQE